MQQPLYIADISPEFHFVEFTDFGYILYDSSSPQVGDTCYRFYNSVSPDTYVASSVSVVPTDVYDYPVSSDFNYRNDIFDIYIVTFIICFCAIFLINIFSRCIRKGGIFG